MCQNCATSWLKVLTPKECATGSCPQCRTQMTMEAALLRTYVIQNMRSSNTSQLELPCAKFKRVTDVDTGEDEAIVVEAKKKGSIVIPRHG